MLDSLGHLDNRSFNAKLTWLVKQKCANYSGAHRLLTKLLLTPSQLTHKGTPNVKRSSIF